jgi:HYR domain
MRALFVTLLAIFVTVPALGGRIYRLDPESVTVGSGEHFVTLYGIELGVIVRYSGPAGTFELEGSGGGSAVHAWVPTEVVNTAGSYSVTVLGGPSGDSNEVGFEVVDPNPIPLTVAPHDPVTAVAATRDGAIVTFEVVAYGGRDPNPVVTCSPPSGSRFPLGPTSVRCIATNSFGESDEGGVYVFVYDVGSPVLHLPDDMTVPADGPDGATVTFQATATDVIDGNVPVTCAPASGSRFPVGTTKVNCSATDESYNTANGSFTVQVTSTEPERLMIHVPAPITAEAEGAFGAVVMFTVTADGTSDPNPTISCNPTSGSSFPLGTTTVNCVASDRFGNQAADDFTITIVDTAPPQLTIPDPITVDADGPDGATVTFEATAHDAVSGDRPVRCNPASGSRFPVGTTTVVCSADDSFGNSSSGAFDVTVRQRQTQTLVIDVPDPIAVEAENHDGAVVTFTVTAGGTSDPDPDITCTPASGSTFAVGTTTVQCVATDSNGNTASDSFPVHVVDTIDPVISAVSATPDVLSPPNNKLIPVTISVDVADIADAMPRCFVFSVTANEAINGDFRLVSDLELELRASRQHDERVYTVHVRCVDDSANAADGSVNVRVPKGSEQSTTPTPTPKKRAVGGR